MNEQLAEILGLSPEAGQSKVTEDQIIARVKELSHLRADTLKQSAAEKEIKDIMLQSVGAIDRRTAIEIIEFRKAHAQRTEK